MNAPDPTPESPDAPMFREVQPVRQWWIWLIVIGAAALAWTEFVRQIVLGLPTGANAPSDVETWLLFGIFGAAVPAFLLAARLIVEVRHEGVVLRYRPIMRRTIPAARIRACAARRYRPIAEFLGWGIRWWPGRGTAWTVSGNRGVQLELRSGARLLIGSRRPEALADAISALRADAGPSHLA